MYELLDSLNYSRSYYNNTTPALPALPLAETTFTVNATDFDDAIALNTDADTANNKLFRVRVKIPGAMGNNLLNDLKTITKTMTDFATFTGKYRGFAFVVPNGMGDKILGVNPTFRDANPRVTDTKVSLYYTDGERR